MTRKYPHPQTADLELTEVLRALADPIRLRIVARLLDSGETTCSPLAADLGIADSTLSHHLRQMREAGITRTKAEGVLRWTSLRHDDLDERFPGLLNWLRDSLSDDNSPAAARRSALPPFQAVRATGDAKSRTSKPAARASAEPTAAAAKTPARVSRAKRAARA
jgi:DNA-binding transcriptional ArsR family regulator